MYRVYPKQQARNCANQDKSKSADEVRFAFLSILKGSMTKIGVGPSSETRIASTLECMLTVFFFPLLS
jgi:hypothetical protein